MSIKTRSTLKAMFANGQILTDLILEHLIDSYLHLQDDGSQKIKDLLAADKLTSLHIVPNFWDSFIGRVGVGAIFQNSGFTSGEHIEIGVGNILEFEAYPTTLEAPSKIVWGIFKGTDIWIKTGSNISFKFNENGVYTITVAVRNENNAVIASAFVTDWIEVVGDPPPLTQIQIEVPNVAEGTIDSVYDCTIDGSNNITCTVPSGTDNTKLIPKIIHSGTLVDIENGKAIDMSSTVNFSVDIEGVETNYTLTVNVAT